MSYIINDIEIDTEQLELRHAGNAVAIQKKVFELLVFLIRNRERALSKDEIQAAVWPNTIVSETALTRAILKARRALNDDAQTQALIKTVHGVGYRFIGDVQESSLSPNLRHQAEWRTERRNDLLRALTAYGAIAWLGNQMAAMVWEAFEFDKVMLQMLLAISLAGLPVVLAFTWWFRFTPNGLSRRDSKHVIEKASGSIRFYSLVLGALLLGISATVYWGQRDNLPPADNIDRVAILPLINSTGNSEHNWTSLGLMSLFNQQIRSARLATVPVKKVIDIVGEVSTGFTITPELADSFQRIQGANTLVLPELYVDNEDVLSLKLTIFNKGESERIKTRGNLIPTELAQIAGRDLVSLLKPQYPAGRFLAGISEDPFVNELYSRGMYQELSGNLEQARNLFKAAYTQDPDFFYAGYEYAQTTRMLGFFEEAEQLFAAFYDDAVKNKEAKQIVLLSNAFGILHDLKGDLDKAETLYKKGIQVAADNQLHEGGGNLLFNYAIIEKNRGNLLSARNLLGQAATAYQKDRISVSGSLYITLGNVAVNEGDLYEAGQNYEKARTQFIEQQSLSGEAIALSNLSWLAQQEKRFDDSLNYMDQSIEIRKRTSDKVGLIKGLIRQADLQYAMGEFDACAETTEQILNDAHVQDENDLLATALAFRGMLAFEQNEFDRAIKDMSRVIDIRVSRQDVSGQLRMSNLLAKVYIAQKQYEQAESLLNTTLAEARTKGFASIESNALRFLAQTARLRDGLAAGAASYAKLLSELRSNSDPTVERTVAIDYAQILMELDDLDAAAGILGSLTDAEPDRQLLLAQAEFAYKNSLQKDALSLMLAAKEISRQRWTQSNENRLADYSNSIETMIQQL